MKYIRVETMNTHTEETLGGYICAAHSILSVKLGVPPTISDEELARIINESDDPEVEDVFSTIMVLSDIPQPEIYIQDKQNKICLYQQSEFDECYEELVDISMMLSDVTDGEMILIYKEFDLAEEEILYDDGYQVVISRETYEKYKDSLWYDVLLSLPIDEDFM